MEGTGPALPARQRADLVTRLAKRSLRPSPHHKRRMTPTVWLRPKAALGGTFGSGPAARISVGSQASPAGTITGKIGTSCPLILSDWSQACMT